MTFWRYGMMFSEVHMCNCIGMAHVRRYEYSYIHEAKPYMQRAADSPGPSETSPGPAK